MVEGGTLLRCCTGKTGAAGSNPALSAKRPGTSRAFPFVALGGWSFPFLPSFPAGSSGGRTGSWWRRTWAPSTSPTRAASPSFSSPEPGATTTRGPRPRPGGGFTWWSGKASSWGWTPPWRGPFWKGSFAPGATDPWRPCGGRWGYKGKGWTSGPGWGEGRPSLRPRTRTGWRGPSPSSPTPPPRGGRATFASSPPWPGRGTGPSPSGSSSTPWPRPLPWTPRTGPSSRPPKRRGRPGWSWRPIGFGRAWRPSASRAALSPRRKRGWSSATRRRTLPS